MFRIYSMSEDFMNSILPGGGATWPSCTAEMGAIRQHEKDMIIGYEKPEAVKAAHTKWLESQEKAKKVANQFLQGEEGWTTPWCDIIKRLDSYKGSLLPTWHASWKLAATTRPPLPTA